MNNKTTPKSNRLVYQPYIFAISLLALLVKVVSSVSQRTEVFDALMWIFIVVFVISSILYLVERRAISKRKSMEVGLKVGNISESKVLGAEAKPKDQTKIDITTKDIRKSEVTGYKEQKD
jgi:hypothetical protein